MKYFVVLIAVVSFSQASLAKVYKNIAISKSEKSFHLDDYKNQTFLNFMQKEVFPALNEQASRQRARDHISGVMKGEAVEIRLTNDVSTYHVKYKAYGEDKAERSGRSFSAVGSGSKIAYVADASYKHYLTTLGEYVKGSESEVRNFYKAVIEIIINNDVSSVKLLSREGKEVLADFVAVYVAEQYRHMMSGNGRGSIGKSHNWDDAHLQVTLLAAFHGGQGHSQQGMFYEGEYTTDVYPQLNEVSGKNACVYKGQNLPERRQIRKRQVNMTDYWQFNRACERSGVNLTRNDFTKMGTVVTESLLNSKNAAVIKNLATALGVRSMKNAFGSIAAAIISNSAPASHGQNADRIVDAILDLLMTSNQEANQITNEILRK